jgi:GTP cyclohydrolase I
VTLLEWIGEDPSRDGLVATPRRVIDAWVEMTSGYHEDPAELLSVRFEAAHDEIVVLNGIRFSSLCEHHILPFTGTASVAYLPGEKIVGLSKLARLVSCYARRLQVQERLTDQIASALMEHAGAAAAAVVIRASHHCMGCRGVRQPDAVMVTSSMLGLFRDTPEARAEVLRLMTT